MSQLTTKDVIHIALAPCDMRKSVDGLCLEVLERYQKSPQCNELFLFRNKRGDKIKLLFWHRNGFCILYKRLESNRFIFPRACSDQAVTITEEQLQWLLAGLDFSLMSQWPELIYSEYT